jgi:hypothetical protein
MDKRNLWYNYNRKIRHYVIVLRNTGDYTNIISDICAKQSFHICSCISWCHVDLQNDQQLQSIRPGNILLTLRKYVSSQSGMQCVWKKQDLSNYRQKYSYNISCKSVEKRKPTSAPWVNASSRLGSRGAGSLAEPTWQRTNQADSLRRFAGRQAYSLDLQSENSIDSDIMYL